MHDHAAPLGRQRRHDDVDGAQQHAGRRVACAGTHGVFADQDLLLPGGRVSLRIRIEGVEATQVRSWLSL
jgi:hypothetical protein